MINTETEDLVDRVQHITGGKGFALAFDPIAGPGLETLAKAAGREATIIEYGALDPRPTPYPLFAAIRKGIDIRAYTLFQITTDPERSPRARKFVTEGLSAGVLKPIIAKTFKFDEIADIYCLRCYRIRRTAERATSSGYSCRQQCRHRHYRD